MTLEVLCAGELMWDLYAPPGETLETARSFARVPGGAAANVALALSCAGFEAGVVGAVSDDAVGVGLRAALAARDVDVRALVVRPGRTGIVFVDGAGERFVSYRPEGAPEASLPLVGSPAIVHLAALDPEVDRLASFRDLAARARAEGAAVTVDVNARPRAWRGRKIGPEFTAVVGGADLVKVSADDLRVLALAEDDALGASLGLSAAATLVITRGGGAISASGPWGAFALRPDGLRGARSVGAGDAFSAGLLAAMLEAPRRRDTHFWRAALTRATDAARKHVGAAATGA